ncbi:hypothetical protein SARC_02779 [Sphaeroforma arctica JP610]|uniref:Strawberry notch AAA domain-containing protein n=1 Tax=Sphaeroforma arctica JP610 TaxID=667725 RepID=A0A0L0G7Q3_9EUKA|nr:hypothetical protein SARC_02779 [Sphaeroforma arctica JP610]KNC85025.1 hypothetical protein SARC_02779 [Sphaeroforma arctica JP610]|eukprot:XP_014158927.1 hypothetical protein SARC_02779 [Sphaeroforma arctica JP610]
MEGQHSPGQSPVPQNGQSSPTDGTHAPESQARQTHGMPTQKPFKSHAPRMRQASNSQSNGPPNTACEVQLRYDRPQFNSVASNSEHTLDHNSLQQRANMPPGFVPVGNQANQAIGNGAPSRPYNADEIDPRYRDGVPTNLINPRYRGRGPYPGQPNLTTHHPSQSIGYKITGDPGYAIDTAGAYIPHNIAPQHIRMQAQENRVHMSSLMQPNQTPIYAPGFASASRPLHCTGGENKAYRVGVAGTNHAGTYDWAPTYRETTVHGGEPVTDRTHTQSVFNGSTDSQPVTHQSLVSSTLPNHTSNNAAGAGRVTSAIVEGPTIVRADNVVPPAMPSVTNAPVNEEEAEEEETEIFSSYKCLSISFGKTHPGNIVEGASLASAHLPIPSYPLHESMPDDIISSGKLSNLQLEAILFASQRHQKLFNYRLTPDGEPMHAPRLGSGTLDLCTRAGFFIGDQTGVGKGRQSAGIIIANVARGRGKHVWFSTSSDLRADAERDMRDLGSYINIIDGCKELDKQTGALSMKGVLFCTYATLARPARLEEIIKWCGGDTFDGCLIFDESHKAKNLKMEGRKSSGSMTAAAALHIQRRMPLARVTYLSATGVTEPAHLGFMERLGLWGPHTSFPNFKAFHSEISKHSIAVLELIAMEMKMNGTYVSRGLSYSDCEFEIVETDVSKAHGALYDQCCNLWAILRGQMKIACKMTNTPLKMLRNYWACHQRFFLQLCVSLKVGRIVELAKAALARGDCVVIGLQKTGESSSDAVLDLSQPDKIYPSPIAVEKEILMRFIAEQFPTKMAPKDVPGDPDDPNVIARKRIEEQRSMMTIPELVQTRNILIQRAGALQMPGNPLDLLIDELGGPTKVAEMTGRKGRMVRAGKKGFIYEKRAETEDDTTHICNNEKIRFMNGDKLVAIISEAASTGISLHASLNVRNQRRRHHFTIELPWSADRAIQQLGRTHRSHQKTGPIYKLVVCSLAGELRCVMAVCSRLQSLGALTRGDRRASVGFNFDDYDIDNKYGKKALKDMSHSIRQRTPYPGVDSETISALEQQAQKIAQGSADQALGKPILFTVLAACIDLMAFEDGDEGKVENIRSFWNRLLGLTVAQQGILFGYLSAVLKAVVNEAKRDGTYLDNVLDLKGEDIMIQSKEILSRDPSTDVPTIHYQVLVNRGVSFPVASYRLEQAQAAFSGRAAQTDGDTDSTADKIDEDESGENVKKGVDNDRGETMQTNTVQITDPAEEVEQPPNTDASEPPDIEPGVLPVSVPAMDKDNTTSETMPANTDVNSVRSTATSPRNGGYVPAETSDPVKSPARLVEDEIDGEGNEGEARNANSGSDGSDGSDVDSKPDDKDSDSESDATVDSDDGGEENETYVDYSGFFISKVPHFGRYMLLLATGKAGNPFYVNIYRPNTGKGVDIAVDTLLQRYKLVKPEEMEQQWTEFYDATKDHCTHKSTCRCSSGKRTVLHHIINGNIVQQWSTIQGITQRFKSTQAAGKNNMQIVRLETSTGERLVGISLNEQCIFELSMHLREREHVLATTHTRANMTIEPVGTLKIKQLQRAMTKPRDITTYFGAASAVSKQEPKVEHEASLGRMAPLSENSQKRNADNIETTIRAKIKPIVHSKKRKVTSSKKSSSNPSLLSLFNKQRSKKPGVVNSGNAPAAPSSRHANPTSPAAGPKEEPTYITLD